MKTYLTLAAASALSLATGVASAAAVTGSPGIGSMNVTATVTTACNDLTVSDMDFGSHPQSEDSFDATTTVSVTCGTGVAYSVELDYGANGLGTLRQLADSGSGEFLDYVLYQPGPGGASAKTTEWGLTADGAQYDGTGSGAAQALTVTGTVTYHSGTSPGTFSDLVTVTLSF